VGDWPPSGPPRGGDSSLQIEKRGLVASHPLTASRRKRANCMRPFWGRCGPWRHYSAQTSGPAARPKREARAEPPRRDADQTIPGQFDHVLAPAGSIQTRHWQWFTVRPYPVKVPALPVGAIDSAYHPQPASAAQNARMVPAQRRGQLTKSRPGLRGHRSHELRVVCVPSCAPGPRRLVRERTVKVV
jgi:hypothetical protein